MHKSKERQALCELFRYKRLKERLLREIQADPEWKLHGEQIGYTEQDLKSSIAEIETCIYIFRKYLLPSKLTHHMIRRFKERKLGIRK